MYADSAAVSKDIAAFITYIEAFAHSTNYHHKGNSTHVMRTILVILIPKHLGEEKFLFPALEKAGVPEAAATVNQHKAIHGLVESLESFVADVRKVYRFPAPNLELS
jgi:hypothetical protein